MRSSKVEHEPWHIRHRRMVDAGEPDWYIVYCHLEPYIFENARKLGTRAGGGAAEIVAGQDRRRRTSPGRDERAPPRPAGCPADRAVPGHSHHLRYVGSEMAARFEAARLSQGDETLPRRPKSTFGVTTRCSRRSAAPLCRRRRTR